MSEAYETIAGMNIEKTWAKHPEVRARRRRRLKLGLGIGGGIVVLLVILAVVFWPALQARYAPVAPAVTAPAPAPKPEPAPEPEPEPEPEPAPTYDVDSPSSITVVVNKQRPMNPIDWAPDDLVVPEGIPSVWGHPIRAEAATALRKMYDASVAAGVPITITSGYRDYELQKEIYDDLVAQGGVEFADQDTARPGFSEHQTGLVVDLEGDEGCALSECFRDTATGAWLRENSWQYGYILRYNEGEQPTVGYTFEPWHFRYVGVEVATAMHEQGVKNLEDFLGLPAAPTNLD